MITDEHFETLRQIREQGTKLRLACIAASTGSLLHIAYDRDISQRKSPHEEALLGKLRRVK